MTLDLIKYGDISEYYFVKQIIIFYIKKCTIKKCNTYIFIKYNRQKNNICALKYLSAKNIQSLSTLFDQR